MRTSWKHLDKFRVQSPPYTSRDGETFGAFTIAFNGVHLNIIATDGRLDSEGKEDTGWEHVSIHVFDPVFNKRRIPKWEEMCHVKSLFWDDDEVVVEFHVAKKDWISINDSVLHLWRSTKESFPLPAKIFV